MKKVLSWLLIAVMAISLCPAALAEATGIDFEDGAAAFAGVMAYRGNADSSDITVADFNGSKAMKIESKGKVPYIAFNLEGLLGENLPKVRSIRMDIGIDEGPDGKFYAVSGLLYTLTGADQVETTHDWSVYLAKKNPRTFTFTLGETEVFTADSGNYMVLSKEVDNYATKHSATPLPFYVDNIAFLDADGNALPVDTAAVYVKPNTGRDLSNLAVVQNATEIETGTLKNGGWAQTDMPAGTMDLLVPGSVLELDYASADGTMWIVIPDAQAGWMRVGAFEDTSYRNNSRSIAQITYEQIAAVCGEDKSTWGGRVQVEAMSDYEVYAARVGTPVNQIIAADAVDFTTGTVSGGGWAQADLSSDIMNALVPGSVIVMDYASEDGSMWIVIPDAQVGWSRIGMEGGTHIDGKCYVTYEQIAAVCGEDKSTWGGRVQAEAMSSWEVYAVCVGKKTEFVPVHDVTEFAMDPISNGGWAQTDLPGGIIEALQPGMVITLTYESADNSIWVVVPDSQAGWMRVGGCGNGNAAANGSVAQISYEQIAQLCGEDKATWGTRLQGEAMSDWTIYSIAVGYAAK